VKKKIDKIQKIWYPIRTMKHDYTFDSFMKAVDAECSITLGCSAHDLPDYPYFQDWETCQEDLAFIAPEDTERRERVFNNHVGCTIQDLEAENLADANPYVQGHDY
jgi:hypothetical protein